MSKFIAAITLTLFTSQVFAFTLVDPKKCPKGYELKEHSWGWCCKKINGNSNGNSGHNGNNGNSSSSSSSSTSGCGGETGCGGSTTRP